MFRKEGRRFLPRLKPWVSAPQFCMSDEETRQQILFSPIGKSDPITNMYDGPCLHIVRHYHPQRVVLFLTKELAEQEKEQHRYTLPIHNIFPDIEIETIATDIDQPQQFDACMPDIPQAIYDLHDRYPDAEILLNTSSGTPAMKMIVALVSIQETWCRSIQVNNPEWKQDRRNDSSTSLEDLTATNLDNEPGAANRCVEPSLRVLHFYEDKNRIESLIDQYEYHAAFLLSRNNPEIPKEVKQLLEHADLRLRLQSAQADKVLSKYKGIKLFPFKGMEAVLLEYFLTIQLAAKKKQLADILIKMTPFLYETLREFVKAGTTIKIEEISVKDGSKRPLQRKLIGEKYPYLLEYLDRAYSRTFRDNTELSVLTLKHICKYAEDDGFTNNMEQLKKLNEVLSSINSKVFSARNEVAHNITNIDEAEFRKITGMDADKLVKNLFEVLCLLYPQDNMKKIRNIYQEINTWIYEALKTRPKV